MKALILFLPLSLHKRQQAVLQSSSPCTGRRRRAMQCTIGGFFHKGNSDGKEGKGEEVERKEFSPPLPVLLRSNGPKIHSRMRLRSFRLSLPLSFACGGPQKSNLRERPVNAGTDIAGMRLHREQKMISPPFCVRSVPGLRAQHPGRHVLAHLHAPIGNTFGRAADP